MSKPKIDPKGMMPTVAETKACWEGMIEPSLVKVLTAMHEAGFSGLSHSKLQRWKAAGWKVKEPPPMAPAAKVEIKAELKAAEAVAAAVESGTAIATTTGEAVRREVANFTMSQLAELAMKESFIAQIALARASAEKADLIANLPKEAGSLIEALKGPAANVTVNMGPVNQPVEELRTVEGVLIENDEVRPPTALQSFIRNYQQTQGLKVVSK